MRSLRQPRYRGGDLLQPGLGFLTGKYRQPSDLTQSQRGSGIGKYLNPRGMRIIDTLAAVADEQGAKPAEVALAWPIGREGVTAPIASATSVAQVEALPARRR